MELLQLQYFRTVARLEHMTKAAQELRIAQPALSKTIARLEENLGVPLFDRQGRQIRLNTFGKVFLEKAETALTALEEGRRQVNDLAGMKYGTISLATSTLNRLSEPLGMFLSQYPEVNFQISQASMDEIADLIENGEVDFGFTALPIGRQGIREQTVINEEVFLAVPAGHRLANRRSISLSEVANDSFIGYKEGYLFQKMNNEFCKKAGITPKIVCEVDEPSSIANLVRAGLGVAFIGACNKDDTSLVSLHIDEPVCQRAFQLAWNEKHYLSKAALEFRDFIVQYFDQLQK
ncbi:LysR family transcriptional regulator [Paenibacillus sedimenti]|uniref:LysR family transcriptional regulator n=1 Tax=Paenibacillus sedimenti TaxID=2770274 RepID=A0A926KVL3_9BACL|nr:LysR family transcriptional regulator [Paenibacillus sedimenti]MBD0383003.1 LysR family transcriptional regulator [Paenibacillus sedimenti]